MLYGRDDEQSVIDDLLAEVRRGCARALFVRGEAGIGKSALLDHLADKCREDFRVLRVTGVESEIELPFAALHMILAPALSALDDLPGPQAEALRVAFGQTPGGTANPFLVGLASLSLIAELSPDRPLLLLVDDAQWVDHASTAALLFVVRRLHAEPVGVVFAARDGERGRTCLAPLGGMAELRLTGLGRAAAEQLVAETRQGLAVAVRERIVKESEGNPLALVELTRQLTEQQCAGGFVPLAFSLDAPPSPANRVLSSFRERILGLEPAARQCLLVAALTDSEDADTIAAAVTALGLSLTDFAPAEHLGLVHLTLAGSVRFRHPLVRAAALAASDVRCRMTAHRALADTSDADVRVWHLAAMATGPDEEVAAAMEQAALRAGDRAAPAAKSVAFERAADLTADHRTRARRLLEAAAAALDVAQLPRARDLAVRAARLTADPAVRAGSAAIRGAVEFESGMPHRAARTHLDAAELVVESDPGFCVTLLSIAAIENWYAGARPELTVLSLLIKGLMERLPETTGPLRELWLAMLPLGEHPWRAAPLVGGPLAAIETDPSWTTPAVRATVPQLYLVFGDLRATARAAARLQAEFRAVGLIGLLVQPLTTLAIADVLQGRLRDAMTTAEEALRIARDTDQRYRVAYLCAVLAWIHALTGGADASRRLADEAETLDRAGSHVGQVLGRVYQARTTLALSQGRYPEAADLYTRAKDCPATIGLTWVIYSAPDQVEVLARTGDTAEAELVLERFSQWAQAVQQPWAIAEAARCRALLVDSAEAGPYFEKALDLYQEADHRYGQARTELLYGEWLRRDLRRAEARSHLRAAIELFDALGASLWLERAANELRATGVPVPYRTQRPDPLAELTPQEIQVVRLAAAGASNREIGAQLFLSPRTVGYHLYKVFPKLGVKSRAELAGFQF